jgi:hypothetical protein
LISRYHNIFFIESIIFYDYNIIDVHTVSYNVGIKIKSELRKIWENRLLLQTMSFCPSFRSSCGTRNWHPRKTYSFSLCGSVNFSIMPVKKQISAESYQENIVSEFLEALKSDLHLSDWQIRQASDDIRVSFFHYRGMEKINPHD